MRQKKATAMPLIRLCLALVLVVGAMVPANASAADSVDALPVGVSSFSSGSAASGAALDVSEHAHYFQTTPETVTSSASQQSYWPMLYSALVPGLGELTMGYKGRGIALMAVDVAAWIGYFSLHSDGLDQRDAYEAFADMHWEQQKFIDDHPLVYPLQGQTQDYLEEQGQAVSGSGGDWWTGYIPWVSKEDDKQHYYENIGKYDWFVSGWSDYDPTVDPPLAKSALRDQYVDMRNESNNSLDDANAFVWVSLAARAVSLVDTAIIIHNRRNSGDQALRMEPAPVAVRARARGFDGGELALEVRFK
jgi:hypothetical protein